MKEDEAETKWCPMARTGMMFATNRSENGCINDEDQCIASACMMWRWEREPYFRSKQGDLPPVSGIGYCGLAGKL